MNSRRCLFGADENVLFQRLLICSLFVLFGCVNEDVNDRNEKLTQYVDPFIGTDGPGNTYPGVACPHGMVQLSPDNGLPGWDRISGYYWQDSTIAGFSHKHLTGTGAGDLYDVLVFPYNSKFKEDLWPDNVDYRPFSKFNHDKESARPGYYSVDLLSSGIKAELTSTYRIGMHRYTFPKDEESKVLIDLGYKLNWDNPTDTYIKMYDNHTLVGYRFSTGWAPDQREFFVIQFSIPIEYLSLYENNKLVNASEVKAAKTKAELKFSTMEGEQLLLKVALSSHSIEGAFKNMQVECPDWNFDEVVTKANHVWENKLSCIKVKGTEYQKRVFYTNLYHCFLTPSLHSDVDGWYKGADGDYHQAKGYNRYDTFSLWDTYRTAHPLYTIVEPDVVEDYIKSFLAHYNETGLLPVWSMAGNETNMMIGYHSVPVIVDAFFKGIPMDTLMAYNACKETALSDAWNLPEYKEYGYVPADGRKEGQWSVSKTLEYAYDDWCIAQFAKALNKEDDYQYFDKRANNWKNLFDKETGFLRPQMEDGTFVSPFNPNEYSEPYCESNAWQYLWQVQHDIGGLINIMGKDHFVNKLDSMFSYSPMPEDSLPIFSTGMIGQYAHGNEPGHHVPYLYNYVGLPEMTQKIVRQIIESYYNDKPNGYCGNEDCGQMSSWLVMSALGLFPVNPANGIYQITSPWVKEAVIKLPNGKKYKIMTENNEQGNVLIDTVWLNNQPLKKFEISHQQLMQGGTLLFKLKANNNM